MPPVSVLFVAKNSVYKTLGVDCWDEERDALKWPGGNPGVFHPPCRLFSKLRHMSTAPESEKELAYWSVEQVRRWGGVLEHPEGSRLWKDTCLPSPGCKDEHGLTLYVEQHWFGHPGKKATWLYVCGLRGKIPDIPYRIGYPENVFAGGSRKYIPGSRHSGVRSATSPDFAKWLIEVASRCRSPQPT